MTDIEDDESSIKRICHYCIGEAYLAAEIRSSGEEAVCDYCGETAPSIGIGALAGVGGHTPAVRLLECSGCRWPHARCHSCKRMLDGQRRRSMLT